MAAFHNTFPGDLYISQRVQEVHSGLFTAALDHAEDVADLPLVLPVWLAASALLLVFVGRLQALLMAATMLGRLLNFGLKEIIERPRPSPDLVRTDVEPTTFSFPSGHAQAVMLTYGLIFYFATVHIKQAYLRLTVQAASLSIIALTGLERIYAGRHWASDVLAGFYVGALLLAALVAIERVVSRAKQRRPDPAAAAA